MAGVEGNPNSLQHNKWLRWGGDVGGDFKQAWAWEMPLDEQLPTSVNGVSHLTVLFINCANKTVNH